MADPSKCCSAHQRSHENKATRFQEDEYSGADCQWRGSLFGNVAYIASQIV